MSYLRGSMNYVWCTTSVLGKGATGAVYQGVNKHNGEPVAVKTFNQVSHLRPPEVQMREFEVLKKVKHENIVKLLAIEEEVDGRGKVIVMELCTGGSLFNILDDPENTYGLEETEFIHVLAHLSAGMKHLRDLNMVHRDLKPGNIMKFVAPDGSTIYKLTDFGAARELDDDQQFMSLYGTEEYLHPDMYERAVLRKPVGKTFNASVDLWSIGVTLFHVATGQLPFRPFGGRKNKETMHYITTEKASGVISGIQTSENGPIEWSRDFPDTCLLSKGLQTHVTALLGGLMEVDPLKMWTFDKFFAEVTRVLARKPIKVYCVNTTSNITVFLDPTTETFEDFRRLIQSQTKVIPDAQILLRNGFILDGLDEQWKRWQSGQASSRAFRTASFTPQTPDLESMAMFDREDNNVRCTTITSSASRLPKFPNFPTVISVENDASTAKVTCSVAHAVKRVVEDIREAHSRSYEAVGWLTEVVVKRTQELLVRSEEALALALSLKQRLLLAKASASAVFPLAASSRSDNVDDLCSQLEDLVSDKTASCSTVEHQLTGIYSSISSLHRKLVDEESMRRQWNEALEDAEKELMQSAASNTKNVVQRDFDVGKAFNKAATYVAKLRESWQHLLRDRAARNLTYNDEQFHMLEKIKMQETSKLIQSLLQQECVPTLNHIADALADWFKAAQVNFVQLEVLEKDLVLASDATKVLAANLNLAQDRFQSGLSVLSSRLSLSVAKKSETSSEKKKRASPTGGADGSAASPRRPHRNQVPKVKSNKDYVKNTVNRLNEMYAVQAEVWDILQENNELIAEFCQVTTRLAGVDHQPPPPPPTTAFVANDEESSLVKKK